MRPLYIYYYSLRIAHDCLPKYDLYNETPIINCSLYIDNAKNIVASLSFTPLEIFKTMKKPLDSRKAKSSGHFYTRVHMTISY